MRKLEGFKHLKSTGSDCVSLREITFGLDELCDDLEELIGSLEIPNSHDEIHRMSNEYGYEDVYRFAFDQIRYFVRIHEKVLQMAHFGLVQDYEFLLNDIRHGWYIYEEFLCHSAIWKG